MINLISAGSIPAPHTQIICKNYSNGKNKEKHKTVFILEGLR